MLAGFFLLWIAAGAGVMYSTRTGLINAIDTDLAVDAQILRFAARGEDTGKSKGDFRAAMPPPSQSTEEGQVGQRRPGWILQQRAPAYDEPRSGIYFQSWNSRGELVEKSPSLENLDLPVPEITGTNPVFVNETLPEGDRLRIMSFRVSGPGKAHGKSEMRRPPSQPDSSLVVSVAKNLDSVDDTLSTLLGGIALVGLLAGGATVILVGTALKRGLQPLGHLAETAQDIDVPTLDSRFDPTMAPEELRPVYEKLNNLMERLERGFERERRFSSNLSHELRTPIAELKMLSEVALKWPDQSEGKTHEETLEIARKMEAMIESLLALARWESRQDRIKLGPIPLLPLVHECLEPHQKLAAGKSLEVRARIDEDLHVAADRGMLGHVISNLLSNAIEYSPERGRVEIECVTQGIEISNDAPNLKPSDIEHLFDRFWRHDAARSDSHHNGLGLSLARACAEAMGFSLSAKMDDGRIHFQLKFSV